MTPRWEHDCEKCEFKGTHFDQSGNAIDFWICGKTLIFRFSNEPSDYFSMTPTGLVNDARRDIMPFLLKVLWEQVQNQPSSFPLQGHRIQTFEMSDEEIIAWGKKHNLPFQACGLSSETDEEWNDSENWPAHPIDPDDPDGTRCLVCGL